ncbi:MAG: hypothetical protein V2A77_07690 [Pseudomonadota bacterium]
MTRYLLAAKAVLSALIAFYLPAYIPFLLAYWAGVGFLYWRGGRGLSRPGAPTPRVAVEYLGGYPGFPAPQNIWLTTTPGALASGGLSIPYETMRRVRILNRAEGEAVLREQGLAMPAPDRTDLFLAVLWREAGGAEREFICRLPQGKGGRNLAGLKNRVEALRLEAAARRERQGRRPSG